MIKEINKKFELFFKIIDIFNLICWTIICFINAFKNLKIKKLWNVILIFKLINNYYYIGPN